MNSSNPFAQLIALEQRYRRRQENFGSGFEGGEVIAGRLALRCNSWYFSLTMDQVAEIIPLPRYTRVPGVKPWLLGIANLRGMVITVIDLFHFLVGEASKQTKSSRIIVVRSEDWLYGLLVDEVIGMRHFADDAAKQPDQIDTAIQPYISAVLQGDGKDWLAFDMSVLLQNKQFLDASA